MLGFRGCPNGTPLLMKHDYSIMAFRLYSGSIDRLQPSRAKPVCRVISHHSAYDFLSVLPTELVVDILKVGMPTTLLDPSQLFSQLLAGALLKGARLSSVVRQQNSRLEFTAGWTKKNLAVIVPIMVVCDGLGLGTGTLARYSVITDGVETFKVQASTANTELALAQLTSERC